jgi:hypothetical protein
MKPVVLFFIVFSTLSFSPYKPKPSTISQPRDNYVAALLSYEGTVYAPAGDPGGISCSTLVRKALSDAVSFDEVKSFAIESNPCVSDELAKGCGGQLSHLLHSLNLKNVDYSKLKLGDIAVLGNDVGIHTMAYIGNQSWIHADPISGKVVKTHELDEADDWLNFQVDIMRWNILTDR